MIASEKVSRMLPDILPVSELIGMWQKIREATGLAGRFRDLGFRFWGLEVRVQGFRV